jgi:dTDP-4-dehydrorhamnose 3,5-epimerase
MNITETKLKGCYIIEPKVFEDTRGYFFETFNKEVFSKLTHIDLNFVQDNESLSLKGVLRGLHYQIGEYAQAKLVRVIKGSVLDVVVDIRENSPTFGQHITIELSGENKKQLFVPRGFAHGFVVLQNNTVFNYKCDNYYNKASERGITYNDRTLDIDWQLEQNQILVSEKDAILPSFKNAELW